MRSTNSPVRLWDYCCEYASYLRSLTTVNHISLDGVTPFEKVHGYSPNIAEFLVFKWYEWVWYYDPSSPDKQRLGRWLGPAHNCGQGLAYHVLSDKGKAVTRSTVTKISNEEMESAEFKLRKDIYSKSIEETIGNLTQATLNSSEDKAEDPYKALFDDDELDDEDIEFPEVDKYGRPIGVPDNEYLNYEPFSGELEDDNMIGMKVPVPFEGELRVGTIVSRKRDSNGNPIGTKADNPIMDSRIYEVEFSDGSYDKYMANTIIENIYAHVDDEGRSHSILKAITSHKASDDAITKDQGFYFTPSGVKCRVITTKR